jgi:hypothetical protein
VVHAARRRLRDLLAAAVAVGDDEGVFGGRAHGGQQHPLAAPHRDLVLRGLEAERARHAAAAGVGRVDLELEPLQQRALAGGAEDGLVVAVLVHQRLAITVSTGRGL